MYERPDTMVALLAAVDQEREPCRSSRVANALKRAVERDLERYITSELMSASAQFVNARRDPLQIHASGFRSRRATVLATALVHCRDDSVSKWFLGCTFLASGNAKEAQRQFLEASSLVRDRRTESLLYLNVGVAGEMGGDFVLARDMFRKGARAGKGLERVLNSLFGAFVSLRLGAQRDASNFVDQLFHCDPIEVDLGISTVKTLHEEKKRQGNCASTRLAPPLEQLGRKGAYVSRALTAVGTT